MKKIIILVYTFNENQEHSIIEGKFLQLVLNNQEYLLFAPIELHHYHNQLLGCFLDEQSLPYQWKKKQTLDFDVAGLTVLGGGRYRVDLNSKILTLYDNSQVYGRFDQNGLIEKITKAGHSWSDFVIKIE